ncbi:MAG: hypothetical protein HY360_21015 [Verrucomicrobia bacterium]|nr:hypothetical protein [Verrucomicrobiota bacterium]
MDQGESDKAARIKQIKAAEIDPTIRIIATDLTEDQALLVETALIWKLGTRLTNKNSGRYASKFRPQNTLHRRHVGFDFSRRIHLFNVGEFDATHRSWDDCRNHGFLSAGFDFFPRETGIRVLRRDVLVAINERPFQFSRKTSGGCTRRYAIWEEHTIPLAISLGRYLSSTHGVRTRSVDGEAMILDCSQSSYPPDLRWNNFSAQEEILRQRVQKSDGPGELFAVLEVGENGMQEVVSVQGENVRLDCSYDEAWQVTRVLKKRTQDQCTLCSSS